MCSDLAKMAEDNLFVDSQFHRFFVFSPFAVRQREGKRREDNSVRVKNSFMAFLNWGSAVGGGFATPGGKNPSVAGIASTASTTSNSTSDSEDLSSDNDELDFLVTSYFG